MSTTIAFVCCHLLQPANGYSHIVNRAKAFAVIGVSMMKTAAQVAAKSIAQRDCAAKIVPPAANHTASANSGEYGTSNFITSLALSVPVFSL